ncbi:MAG TPA: c-type cytochrome [Polyangiaceae bacterium]|nr:c-type cytochrome [Polyangiaceae bacterium]
MRAHALLELALVVLFCVASGDLECGPSLTAPQRRGQVLYARMCVVCHGREGAGYAADQAPALSHPDFLASVTDDYLRRAIADGRRDTTMSAWSAARGGPLAAADIDGVVAFVRSWQRDPPAVLDERPASGDIARGGEIFARECTRCHGARGTGGPDVHVGNPDLLASASNGFLRYAIRRGRAGTAMPGFQSKLGEAGVEDVLAQLRSWQSSSPVASSRPAAPASIPLGPTPLHPHGPEPIGFHLYPEVTSVDLVKAELDRGARLGLLDARAPSDYLTDHIAGAVSVPFYDPEPYLASLPKSAWLVCYCACPHAESGQLARRLATSGFTKVTVLDEGFNVWRARSYPTRAGADP